MLRMYLRFPIPLPLLAFPRRSYRTDEPNGVAVSSHTTESAREKSSPGGTSTIKSRLSQIRGEIRRKVKELTNLRKQLLKELHEEKERTRAKEKLKKCPWKMQYRNLPIRAFDIFVTEKFRSMMQEDDKETSETWARVAMAFKALPAEVRTDYEQKAAANAKLRDEFRKKLQKLSGRALYVEENYERAKANIAQQLGHVTDIVEIKQTATKTKEALVLKKLHKEWKLLSKEAKTGWKTRAAEFNQKQSNTIRDVVSLPLNL